MPSQSDTLTSHPPRLRRLAAQGMTLVALALLAVGCESTRSDAPVVEDDGHMQFENRSFAGGVVSFDAPVAADGSTLGLYSGAYVHKQAIRTRLNLFKGNEESSAFSVESEPVGRSSRRGSVVELRRTAYLYNAGSGLRRDARFFDAAGRKEIVISIDTRPSAPAATAEQVAERRDADDAVFKRITDTMLVKTDGGEMVRPQFVDRGIEQRDERGIQGSAGGKYFRKDIPVVTGESELTRREFLDGAVSVLMPDRKDEANLVGCLYGVSLYTEHTGRITGHWRISSVAVFSDAETPYWPQSGGDKPWTHREVKNETAISRTVTRTAYVRDPASGRNLAIRLITDHPPAPLVDPATFDRRVIEDDRLFDRMVGSITVRR